MDSTKSDSNLKKQDKDDCVLISWSDWGDLEAGVECVKKVGVGLDKSSNKTDKLTTPIDQCLGTRPPIKSVFGWPVQSEDAKTSVREDSGKYQSHGIKPLSGVIFNSALEQDIMKMFENIVATAIDEMVKEDLLQNEIIFWKMLSDVIQEAEGDSEEQHSKIDRIEDYHKTSPYTMKLVSNVSDVGKCNKERNRINIQQKLTAAVDGVCEEFSSEYTMETCHSDFKAEVLNELNGEILNLTETRKTTQNEVDQEGTSVETSNIEPTTVLNVQDPDDKKRSQKEQKLQVEATSSFIQTGDCSVKDHSDADKELRNAARQYVQDVIMVSLDMVRRENERRTGDLAEGGDCSKVNTEDVEQSQQRLNELKALSEGNNKAAAIDDMPENFGRWKRFRSRLRKMCIWKK